jgi:Na+-driven multidrug efflux pump
MTYTPYTEEQKREFRARFRSRRKKQLMVAVPLIIVAIGFAVLPMSGSVLISGVSPDVIGAGMVAFVVGALIFSARNWRCPACNAYLGRSISQRFCQKCGVQLDS